MMLLGDCLFNDSFGENGIRNYLIKHAAIGKKGVIRNFFIVNLPITLWNLLDTFLTAQDNYKAILQYFEIVFD